MSQFWFTFQTFLFPSLEEELGPLAERHRALVRVLELVRVERWLPGLQGGPFAPEPAQVGPEQGATRPGQAAAPAERACEAEPRSEPAEEKVPGRGESQLGNERGRLGKRRAKRAAAPAARAGPSRLERQRSMTLEEILEDLPRQCDKGAKKNAQGYKVAWNGCQCPADVADGGIPVSCVVTAVSVHDSQVAIPLATLKAERKQERPPQAPATYREAGAARCRERTTVERVFGRLKDEFGGRHVRVRGHGKVACVGGHIISAGGDHIIPAGERAELSDCL